MEIAEASNTLNIKDLQTFKDGSLPDWEKSVHESSIRIHCVRFWELFSWEHNDLAAPFWRIYYNPLPGAVVKFNKESYFLEENSILLIAPDTPFQTHLSNDSTKAENLLIGTPVGMPYNLNKNKIYHLFFHFNLGEPYDSLKKTIYKFSLSEQDKNSLNSICEEISKTSTIISITHSFRVYSVIYDLVSRIPENDFSKYSKDNGIAQVLNYIDNNIDVKMSNKSFASYLEMSERAFVSLFKKQTNLSPHLYIIKKRVERAAILLLNSSLTIDEIAINTGFHDRFHLSKTFKVYNGISPIIYRKKRIMAESINHSVI